MRSLRVLIVALAVALVSSAPALAVLSGDGRQMDEYHVTYVLQPDGSADVTLDFVYNFGINPGHGPLLTFPVRVPYDDVMVRVYEYSDFEASSETAPANVYLDEGTNWLSVRMGDENIGDVTGSHRYRVTYTVAAIMNAPDPVAGGPADEWDEFYYNVIGTDWRVPLNNVTVDVTTGVATPLDAKCYQGKYRGDDPCTTSGLAGNTFSMAADSLEPGEAVTMVIAYPRNSFDTAPRLEHANKAAQAFGFTPLNLGGGAVVALLGIWLLGRAIRNGADRQYVGTIPGLAPGTGDQVRERLRDRNTPVTVQFEPPAGLRPGQLGTLIDEKADPRDVTATIIDLAVRGYLRINEAGETGGLFSKQPDYELEKLEISGSPLLPYEAELYSALFAKGPSVKLSALKTTFGASMAKVQKGLYEDVTQRGWFRTSPQAARAGWVAAGVGLLFGGLFLFIWFVSTGLPALIVAPLLVLGVMTLATFGFAPARRPEGTRILHQTQGFERYLVTADARQLKWEEAQDTFSRYLPFAIAFGVADKWANKFEELARETGQQMSSPHWYSGAMTGALWSPSAFGQQLSSFASVADAAISAPAPGASGSSGFGGGGGGGFSGGGGGGGGGGGW